MDHRRTDASTTRRRRADAPPAAEEATEPTRTSPQRSVARAEAPARTSEPIDGDALQALTQMDGADFARLMADVVGTRRPRHKVGDSVTGRVSGVGDKDLWIDLGGKAEAVLSLDEVRGPDGRPTVALGDTLTARVLSIREGELRLSRRLSGSAARDQLEDAMNARLPVEGRVVLRNTGGYVVEIGGVRAFCPTSQIARRVGDDPDAWVGRTLGFLVQQVRNGEAVVSHRVIEEAELRAKAEELWSSLKPGQEREGQVSSLQAFGAFVDLGGVDGLVPLSHISNDRDKKPGDVLKVGQKVRVRVLEVDRARERVSLSLRDAPVESARTAGGLGTLGDLFQQARKR